MNRPHVVLPPMLAVVALICGAAGMALADGAGGEVRHTLTVDIRPDHGDVRVHDRIIVPPGVGELVLSKRAHSVRWDAAGVRERSARAGRRRFVLRAAETRTLGVRYVLPLKRGEDGSASDGIAWGGGAPWYPHAPGRMLTFTLTATGPVAWRVVSQGARVQSETRDATRRVVWRETRPQQVAYLVAGPFTEYLRQAQEPQLMAFLRRPDETLALRYLDLADRYIAMYEDLIGAYPYAKFALVENTRETGYGMPSFTLLGPRVIRLPFIPYTSYPHEILHNWWGNSVYVDHDSGNWSEGLTAYLADHRLKELRGQGAQYRRDALQKYRNFISEERDFPLARFRSGHGDALQAVGYNKAMMLFHMLRRRVGETAFHAALREFYRQHRFEVAGFADLRRVFERASGLRLEWFFDQWVARTGAPRLALDEVTRVARDDGFSVRARLRQTQPGAVYRLDVPVRVAGPRGSTRHRVELASRERFFEVEMTRRPERVAVDPEFDLFRKLHMAEIPPSLGAAFGAPRLTFIVPHGAGEAQRKARAAFVRPWRRPGREVRVISDRAPLPDRGAVWVLGWDNERRALVEQGLRAREVAFEPEAVTLAGRRYRRARASLTVAARTGAGRPLLWSHLAEADPGALARRLRHYNRVSYAVFEGGSAAARGQWTVHDSPLSVRLP